MPREHTGIKTKVEKLLGIECYNNIIRLLWYYQCSSCGHNENKGLRQREFRYALMEDSQLYCDKESEDLFKKIYPPEVHKLLFWRFKGSIKTQKDLNYYLKYLQQHSIIKRINSKKPYKYRLTSELFNELNRAQYRSYTDRWEDDHNFNRDFFFENYAPLDKTTHGFIKCKATEIPRKNFPKHGFPDFFSYLDSYCISPDSIGTEKWTIYGLPATPTTLHKMFTKEEIKEITTCIKNVEENLWKILKLKYKKQRNSDDIEFTGIDFYYHNTRIPELTHSVKK